MLSQRDIYTVTDNTIVIDRTCFKLHNVPGQSVQVGVGWRAVERERRIRLDSTICVYSKRITQNCIYVVKRTTS